jgi:hypothetical protein
MIIGPNLTIPSSMAKINIPPTAMMVFEIRMTFRQLSILTESQSRGQWAGESHNGGDSRPAWGLRWTWLMTVDRGLTRMSRGL